MQSPSFDDLETCSRNEFRGLFLHASKNVHGSVKL